MDILKNYNEAIQAIYDHVGFKEDWVICPIDDCAELFWSLTDGGVKFAESMEQFNSDGDYYFDMIYTQRFYSKHVYEGEKYTMIFCDPRTDGMTWFRVFDNSKRVK